MDVLGGAVEPGRRFRLIVNIAFIAMFAVLAIVDEESRYIALGLLLIGVAGLVINVLSRSRNPQ